MNDQQKKKMKIEIFISHKHEDQEMAALLNQRLELYGAGLVSSFISERISPGVDWFDKIRERLSTADVLLLLFTATHATWDWPLYEVGLATNIDDDNPCKIICFHPPDANPPDPIKFTQSVRADEQGLEDFLYKFFCTSEITDCDPPINPKLGEDREILRQLAAEIAKGFTAIKPWKNYFTKFLWVIVDDGNIEKEEVPGTARIDPESSALELFKLAPSPPTSDSWTWEELIAKADRKNDEAWIQALGERFYWASRGENLKSMTETFTCMQTGQVFRPLVNRIELRSDGSLLFEVILIENGVRKGG